MDANTIEAAANVPTEAKPERGLWIFDKRVPPGGKYLVLRRDGTVFPEPNFVLGARDFAAPGAMRFYAAECERMGVANPEYQEDCRRLASWMENVRRESGEGDAGKGPHRIDHPKVIAQACNPGKRILAPLPGTVTERHRSLAAIFLANCGVANESVVGRLAMLFAAVESTPGNL